MRWRWLALVSVLLASPSALAAPCDDREAVWATTDDGHGVRHLLYGTRSIGEEGAMFIEEWRNGKRAWRTVAARVTCSDDVCTARFADETPPEEVEAAIESIDEDGDGLSDYLVLAGLAQELYYRGGAKVEWDEGFLAKKYGGMFERPSPGSNVFKFLRCRTEPIVLDRSTPYAENRVYHKYRETGSLGSDGTFPEGPGNDIWWMTGEQIQGSDINCVVKSFNTDHTLTASCSAQDSDTTRDRIFSYRFEGMAVFLDDQRLQMLPRQ